MIRNLEIRDIITRTYFWLLGNIDDYVIYVFVQTVLPFALNLQFPLCLPISKIRHAAEQRNGKHSSPAIQIHIPQMLFEAIEIQHMPQNPENLAEYI